jgi:hypothetical protein
MSAMEKSSLILRPAVNPTRYEGTNALLVTKCTCQGDLVVAGPVLDLPDALGLKLGHFLVEVGERLGVVLFVLELGRQLAQQGRIAFGGRQRLPRQI